MAPATSIPTDTTNLGDMHWPLIVIYMWFAILNPFIFLLTRCSTSIQYVALSAALALLMMAHPVLYCMYLIIIDPEPHKQFEWSDVDDAAYEYPNEGRKNPIQYATRRVQVPVCA
jgi:hypothetical protein